MDKLLLQELLKTNYRVIAEQTTTFLTIAAMLLCFAFWINGIPLFAAAYIIVAFIRAMPIFNRIAELKQDLS